MATQNIVRATGTIHLQYVGEAPALEACKLAPGVRTMWNYGETYTVVAVDEASACFMRVTQTCDKTGEPWVTRMKKTRLVGIVPSREKPEAGRGTVNGEPGTFDAGGTFWSDAAVAELVECGFLRAK